jgi:hypothetical protein
MTAKSSATALGDAVAEQLDVGKNQRPKCTTVCPSTSITKRCLVALLAGIYELSPLLAHRLCSIVLAAWPRMRES